MYTAAFDRPPSGERRLVWCCLLSSDLCWIFILVVVQFITDTSVIFAACRQLFNHASMGGPELSVLYLARCSVSILVADMQLNYTQDAFCC